MSSSMEAVKAKVCHVQGHQLTSYNPDNKLICRACGSTLEEIRKDNQKS